MEPGVSPRIALINKTVCQLQKQGACLRVIASSLVRPEYLFHKDTKDRDWVEIIIKEAAELFMLIYLILASLAGVL